VEALEEVLLLAAGIAALLGFVVGADLFDNRVMLLRRAAAGIAR
jgi:hypothetical protein